MPFDNVKYQTEYIKKNLRRFEIKINRNTEPDLMDWLESQENVQAYLKSLIKQDMESKKSST